MQIKVYYRKNLKMSPGKLAAQVAHAVLGLRVSRYPAYAFDGSESVVVLAASDAAFSRRICELGLAGRDRHIVTDAGRTEVPAGTATCIAFVAKDDDATD